MVKKIDACAVCCAYYTGKGECGYQNELSKNGIGIVAFATQNSNALYSV